MLLTNTGGGCLQAYLDSKTFPKDLEDIKAYVLIYGHQDMSI